MKQAGSNDEATATWAMSLSIKHLFVIGTLLVVVALPLTFLIRKKEVVDEESLVKFLRNPREVGQTK
ncbi:hypothetical protein D3C73_1171460 [compost metagenome]